MPVGSSSNQSQASIPGEFPQLLDNWWWQLCDLWPPLRLLNCPLTNTPLEEPVIADDNRTYNAQALQFFFTSQRDSGLSIVSPQHHEAMSDQYQQDAVTHNLLKIIITRLQDSEFLVSALRDIPDDPGAEHQRALGQLILAAKEACHAAVERSQQENMAGSHWLLEKFQEELREHTLAWEATTSTVQFVQPREDLTQLRLAFSKLDELRELLQETLKGWDPPSITVVGTRSAGKSTVLERLSNIPLFPRNPSICTRLPIHVRLRQSVHGNAQVRLFVKDTQSGEEGPSRFIPFESGHRYVDEVQERILIEHESTTGFSTTKQIILEVHHPTVPSIDLIDIPGLEPGDGRGPTHQILESQVNRNREQGSSAVYLLVVSGASRQVNDVASAFIKEHGLLDETLGVFTHCDDVVSRRYHALREMVEDPQANTASLPVRHGWVATMSCDEHESLPGPERLHRQAQVELEFFEEHHELKAMKLAGNATCSALVRRLQRVYFDHLSNTWTPRTLLRIDERIVEIQFQERSQYGRPLGLLSADERSSAIRNEVRTRLSDCTSMITERFLNEHLRSLHKQFLEKLRAISRKSLMLHDIAEHHRSVREEGLQLFTHILREVEAYWKEGIRSIMFAKLECRITNGEYRFLMVRGESTDASEHQWPGADAGHVRSEEGDNAEDELQRLFTCSSIREAHTWLYEDGERVQLNQYPVLLNNLVQEFEKRLDNSIQNLELELTRLHEVAFDVHGHLMTYTSDEDAWKFELNVEQLAGKLMALMMIHGPSSQLLEGLEDSFQIASEVETCETGRQHFNQEVELLQKAARGVRAIFNLTGDQAEDLKRQVEEERRREEEERRQVEEEGRREEEEHRQVEEEQRREEQERHRQQSQGGIARLKKMVPPPNGDAAPDISRFIPLKEGVTPEGVAYIQSCMLVDSDLAKNLYVPIMRQNRSLALQQGMCKQTIDAGIDIINRCADNTLSVEEMVDAGLITCNHTVALRLKSGRLLLYNPQRITHAMKAWIERLGGEVAYIVSPNPAHCLFTQSAMQAFPRAKLVASQQAADKMADLGISTAYNYSNPDRLNALWQDLVDEGVIPNVLAGDPAQIILLYHEKTRTLLEADLSYRDAFAPPKGLITPLMKRKVSIGGSYDNEVFFI
ncbi:hypothetical protein CYMTET_24454 [Cymbomonas tetramitiformis]|uniref:Dynamin GTPase domain-containing protein n=1 Tax=Cymbomonas tetramitiformis TaxID=36881 RepID=A0AAE0L083_9CHLO|nr:hypothetical protein CYMTET_24454 [Cymbomonas tetramitiformis]